MPGRHAAGADRKTAVGRSAAKQMKRFCVFAEKRAKHARLIDFA
jgi:hypothetical protein